MNPFCNCVEPERSGEWIAVRAYEPDGYLSAVGAAGQVVDMELCGICKRAILGTQSTHDSERGSGADREG